MALLAPSAPGDERANRRRPATARDGLRAFPGMQLSGTIEWPELTTCRASVLRGRRAAVSVQERPELVGAQLGISEDFPQQATPNYLTGVNRDCYGSAVIMAEPYVVSSPAAGSSSRHSSMASRMLASTEYPMAYRPLMARASSSFVTTRQLAFCSF